MSLMYGHEDTLVTADELAAVQTPAPMGAFHRPVGFGDYLELVKHRLDRAGINVNQEEYILTEDGQTFFGTMLIDVDGFSRDGVQLTLGIRGSHNQKVPRGICLGNRVIVCSNLMFNGDLANVSTKQTTNVWERLPVMVDNAVRQIPDMAQRESQRIDAYRGFGLKPRVGDAALVELHRRNALSGAQLTRAIREWDEPCHEEHAEDGFTAWRLLNAVTESLKPTGTGRANPETIRQRSAQTASFLDEVVGL